MSPSCVAAAPAPAARPRRSRRWRRGAGRCWSGRCRLDERVGNWAPAAAAETESRLEPTISVASASANSSSGRSGGPSRRPARTDRRLGRRPGRGRLITIGAARRAATVRSTAGLGGDAPPPARIRPAAAPCRAAGGLRDRLRVPAGRAKSSTGASGSTSASAPATSSGTSRKVGRGWPLRIRRTASRTSLGASPGRSRRSRRWAPVRRSRSPTTGPPPTAGRSTASRPRGVRRTPSTSATGRPSRSCWPTCGPTASCCSPRRPAARSPTASPTARRRSTSSARGASPRRSAPSRGRAWSSAPPCTCTAPGWRARSGPSTPTARRATSRTSPRSTASSACACTPSATGSTSPSCGSGSSTAPARSSTPARSRRPSSTSSAAWPPAASR